MTSDLSVRSVTNGDGKKAVACSNDAVGSQWASPDHWFHTTSGLAVFVISMAILFGIMRVLERPE